ncbi:MAG: 4-alpha-glucanotransferase, partial [Opitutales bacterium]|nr:4-alpha-glucanotransferase [Opitutales bacterium]
KESGFSYWQICPLGPTGYGDSPYQSFSAFAGNTYFIDFEQLRDMGFLSDLELNPLRALPQDRCDYGAIYGIIPNLVNIAAERFESDGNKKLKSDFNKFCKTNQHWLDAYALYCSLKKYFNSKSWLDWDKPYRDFSYAKNNVPQECHRDIYAVKFGQWIFFRQYADFKAKAKKCGIEIFGDIPIFLSLDSADVWANPKLFELDKNLHPKNVAGVAPDYFSAEGQLWGNPLFDWRNSKKALFEFWRKRIAAASDMYDVIRFDHFRGFADYWSIPAKEGDARKGSLKKGPDVEFFEYIKKHFPKQKFVAEDLGLLSKASFALRDKIKIPSMAVLQFAFGDNPKNPYLPHNVRRNCVFYTGTHDNNTSIGWYESATEQAKDEARRYFRASGDAVNWDMIHAVMLSVASIAIFPMQDIIGLGAWARTNTPGKPDGNWQWRMSQQQLQKALIDNAPYLHSLCELSDRLKNIVAK